MPSFPVIQQDQYGATAATQCIQVIIPAGDEYKALLAGMLQFPANVLNYADPDSVQADGVAAAWSDALALIDWQNCMDGIITTEITITPATIFPIFLQGAVLGEVIDELLVDVETAFDVGVLTVGDAGDHARLMPATYNNLQQVGQYQVSPEYVYPSATNILIYLTGTPSTGSARIVLYSYLES